MRNLSVEREFVQFDGSIANVCPILRQYFFKNWGNLASRNQLKLQSFLKIAVRRNWRGGDKVLIFE